MKQIAIGFVGLGNRGLCLLNDVILPQKETVAAVCDEYIDRAALGAELVENTTGIRPKTYTDYREMLQNEQIDTVIIATAWESHVSIALAAMRAGKAVAMEVGGAYTLEECFDLVRVQEETGMPFMFLENCCFGRREMMVRNMVHQGLFGKIVYCSGGYHHDLREEIAFGRENRHYRLRNYLTRNCHNYPTHDLGPIARILDINRGNRMVSLSSTASKAEGLHEYILRNKPEDTALCEVEFAQGDIVTTIIKCAHGEMIVLTLDTTLPRYYSRNFTVRGTSGMYEEVTDSVFLDTPEDRSHDFDWRNNCIGNAEKYESDYEHPIWKQYLSEGVQGAHDGMDYLQFKHFFAALRSGSPMPVDVYDAASWMAVTVLSEMSLSKGGMVMEIPDFTNGKWLQR